ncbi:melanization protease 1-like [Zerene cesonia]|uniref:melanization protease 1-like n=1 Tax=Zerene cesonia TaxID=33412 RepID=UPI0018E51EA9|nr:melanization protease 1-like [Zerene cesonia]
MKYIVIFGLLASPAIHCKICSDCKPYTSCPASFSVVPELDDISPKEFKEKYCGVEYINGNRIPKVCCSEVTTKNLDTHPNIDLLPTSCGYIDNYPTSSRVVNLYEFPWIALLSSSTRKLACDAIVINKKYVLTTAFCAEKLIPTYVQFGDYNPKSETDCMPGASNICENFIQNLTIQELIPHPEKVLALPNIKHNIALIRVNDEIDFTHRNIAPICLPISEHIRSANKINKTGIVAGWLLNDTNRREFSTYLKIPAYIDEPQKCIRDLEIKVDSEASFENAFCGTLSSEDKLECNAVNGDPFMSIDKVNNVNRYVLYGIYSHGLRRCLKNSDIYVDITKHMEWILDNIRP